MAGLCFPNKGPKKAPGLTQHEEGDRNSETTDLILREKKHLKILVIDESEHRKHAHEQLLSEAGHSVRMAGSGAEGINDIRKANAESAFVNNKDSTFDLVILSNLVSGMTTTMAIQKIRDQYRGKHCMIMALVDEISVQKTCEWREAGADAVTAAPLTIKKFNRSLRGKLIVCLLLPCVAIIFVDPFLI